MCPLESWNQSSSSPVITWVWTFLCNQQALRAYTQKSFRKPPLWGVSLGPFRTAFCDAVCRETVHTSYLFVGRPKRFNHPLIGQSAFVTLNVRRLHRVNPCEHVVNCCCVTFPFPCCHTKNPMEHTAPNEFGTQRMVTEVWSRWEWQKPEVSWGSAHPQKNPTQRRKITLPTWSSKCIHQVLSCGECMDGLDWQGLIHVYLKCLTQLFNGPRTYVEEKPALDWIGHVIVGLNPQNNYMMCVARTLLWFQCHDLDSYTMTIFYGWNMPKSYCIL